MDLKNSAVPPLQDEHSAWHEPAALTLDERGVIVECSKHAAEIFGYNSLELVWQHVSKVLPQLSEMELFKDGQLNPRLNFLAHCGHHFQVKSRYGMVFLGDLFFITLNHHPGQNFLRLLIQPTLHALS